MASASPVLRAARAHARYASRVWRAAIALTIAVVAVAAGYVGCGSSPSKPIAGSACSCDDPQVCTDSGAYQCNPQCRDGFVCAYVGVPDAATEPVCVVTDGGDKTVFGDFGKCAPNDCACFALNGPSSDCSCQCTDQGPMVSCFYF